MYGQGTLMPNLLAYCMIIMWPFIAIIIYKKTDTVTATFWTIVGGYMFLPVKAAIDLPLIPAIGKDEISAIAALIGCYFIKKERIQFLGNTKLQKRLISLLLIIPFINVFFNIEPMFNGARWMPGLSLYDATSQVLAQYFELLPFIIGISIIKNHDDLSKLSRLLVIAGLVYSVFILIEIRLSPQLHKWTYGFFPHSFKQQVRFGGFRSVVFMGHGLLVSLFCFVCVCCAAIQLKIGLPKDKTRNIVILCYLLAVLVLSKSVGAVILALGVICCVMYLPSKAQLWSAKSIVILFLIYPTLAIFSMVPYEAIVSLISDYSVDKAQSIEFRFTHEIRLIEHAYEKIIIGWGSWARNRLDGSVSDGYWLIILGQYGAIYFFSLFFLFVYPIFSGKLNAMQQQDKFVFIGFSLIIAGVSFDQLLNSSLQHSWLWFIAGAIAGCSQLNSRNNIYSPQIERY